MKELDLTLPRGLVLLTLYSLGSRAKMSELIELLQISGGTLTGIVDRLISAGLVARERDEIDRRVVYVSLTESGAKKVQAVLNTHKVQLDRATAGFTNHELEQFNCLLKKFVAAASVPPGALPNYPEYARLYDLTLAENPAQDGPGQPKIIEPSVKDLSGKHL